MLRLSNVIETAVVPACSFLGMDSDEARVALLAIGLQESRFEARCQILKGGGRGPARGYWQFEKGGVSGVHRHRASHEHLRLLCHERDVSFDVTPIWAQLECDDVLAAGVARLLLYTDPKPLPKLGECQAAWDYYLRCWRPGKPHRKTWDALYAAALQEVGAQRH